MAALHPVLQLTRTSRSHRAQWMRLAETSVTVCDDRLRRSRSSSKAARLRRPGARHGSSGSSATRATVSAWRRRVVRRADAPVRAAVASASRLPRVPVMIPTRRHSTDRHAGPPGRRNGSVPVFRVERLDVPRAPDRVGRRGLCSRRRWCWRWLGGRGRGGWRRRVGRSGEGSIGGCSVADGHWLTAESHRGWSPDVFLGLLNVAVVGWSFGTGVSAFRCAGWGTFIRRIRVAVTAVSIWAGFVGTLRVVIGVGRPCRW